VTSEAKGMTPRAKLSGTTKRIYNIMHLPLGFIPMISVIIIFKNSMDFNQIKYIIITVIIYFKLQGRLFD